MPFFEHDKTKIHYIDVDKRENKSVGFPLLFVHGAGSSHITWSLQLNEFSKTNRCIAIDLSGHGMSGDFEGDVSIDLGYTLEVAALVKHLDLQDFILVGHSMGGGVAMSYVLNGDVIQPKALVLVDTSPDLDLTRLAAGLIIEAVEDRIFLIKSQVFEDFTDTYKLKKYEEEMRSLHPAVFRRDLLACHKFNITDKVANINIPTFVLVGEDDDVISPSMVSTYENLLPRSDLAIVRGANHTPMIEQPEEFNRLLQKFVTWVQETV